MRYAEDERRYVSLAGLRMRGWTGALVHRLLGPPDRISVDPRGRTAPPARLYRAERVEAAERCEEFLRGHTRRQGDGTPDPGGGPGGDAVLGGGSGGTAPGAGPGLSGLSHHHAPSGDSALSTVPDEEEP